MNNIVMWWCVYIYMYNGTIFRDKKAKRKHILNMYTDENDNVLIIRLYIVIELIVSMWKLYNLFICVRDEIMVISACIE